MASRLRRAALRARPRRSRTRQHLAEDIAQTGLDRLGLGDNEAAQTLADAIYNDLQAGREELFGNVNATLFAGASKMFPDGPKYTFYINNQDPVPTWLGSHELNPVTDIALQARVRLEPSRPGGLSAQPPQTVHGSAH